MIEIRFRGAESIRTTHHGLLFVLGAVEGGGWSALCVCRGPFETGDLCRITPERVSSGRAHACLSVCVYEYVYLYICMIMYVCVYIYIYIYVYGERERERESERERERDM